MKKLIIPKGNHRPKWWWLKWPLNTTGGIKIEFQFDESWKKSDWNAWHKLGGFSNGFNHHRQSARIAMRYNKAFDSMQLAAYIYNNGKREIFPLTMVEFNKKHTAYIYAKNDVFSGPLYYFEVNGKSYNWQYKQDQKLQKFGWKLGLYHGGKLPAIVNLITFKK
jgi:hypothetical protein